jgi:carboxypeptidase C (cathepsin A)
MEGFSLENGPFYFPEGSTELVYNTNSWNNHTNMLYVESPAGVGFSVIGDEANKYNNDTQSCVDNFEALMTFYEGYPEYKGRDFFIGGESYGGVYVPYLA